MSSNPEKCIRCHPPGPDDPPITGAARYICDRCSDGVRNPLLYSRAQKLPKSKPNATAVARDKRSHADVPKPRGKRTGKAVTAIVALLLLATWGVGCTLHRECTTDLTVAPAALRGQQPPGEPEAP